jgi:hypothetical protein
MSKDTKQIIIVLAAIVLSLVSVHYLPIYFGLV